MAAKEIFSDEEQIETSPELLGDTIFSQDDPFGTGTTKATPAHDIEPSPSRETATIPKKVTEDIFENKGIDRAATQTRKDAATGLGLGLQLGSQQTGSTDLVSADSLIQVLGGAGLGGLTGGPVGAVAGGLAAGIGVFLSTRSEKKKQKSQRAKEDRYQKMVKEQLAREDKFRRQARLDDLEQLGFDRRANKLQNQQTQYKELTANILRMVNSNAKLKQRFVQQGF